MRYYSAKKDVLVTRYGTGTYIGATVRVILEGERKGETELVHDEDAIVAITDAEFAKYAREYLQLLNDGSIIERDEDEFKDQEERVAREAKAEADKAQAEQKKLEEKAKAEADKADAEADAAKKKRAAEREAAKKQAAEREAADKASAGKKAGSTEK